MAHLYHVTLASTLRNISRTGLVAGHGGNFPGYAGHAHGRLFVCEKPAVTCWWSKLEDAVYANHEPADVAQKRHIPVVLRFLRAHVQGQLHVDAQGSRDCRAGKSYYVEDGVLGPEALEVWMGTGWTSRLSPEIGDLYVARAEWRNDGSGRWLDLDLKIPGTIFGR